MPAVRPVKGLYHIKGMNEMNGDSDLKEILKMTVAVLSAGGFLASLYILLVALG